MSQPPSFFTHANGVSAPNNELNVLASMAAVTSPEARYAGGGEPPLKQQRGTSYVSSPSPTNRHAMGGPTAAAAAGTAWPSSAHMHTHMQQQQQQSATAVSAIAGGLPAYAYAAHPYCQSSVMYGGANPAHGHPSALSYYSPGPSGSSYPHYPYHPDLSHAAYVAYHHGHAHQPAHLRMTHMAPPTIFKSIAQGYSCHQCHTVRGEGSLVFCATRPNQFKKRRCRKKYCHGCLSRYYGLTGSKLNQFMSNSISVGTWQCPACLNHCSCTRCKKDREDTEASAGTAEGLSTTNPAVDAIMSPKAAAPPTPATAASNDAIKVGDGGPPDQPCRPSSAKKSIALSLESSAAEAEEASVDSPSPFDSKSSYASALAAAYSTASTRACATTSTAGDVVPSHTDATSSAHAFDQPALHVPPAVTTITVTSSRLSKAARPISIASVLPVLPLPLVPPVVAQPVSHPVTAAVPPSTDIVRSAAARPSVAVSSPGLASTIKLNEGKCVIILRGLPGSGKSSVAHQLVQSAAARATRSSTTSNVPPSVVTSADLFFIHPVTGAYEFDPRRLDEANAHSLTAFLQAMALGVGYIIVDNTNIELWEYRNYKLAAKLFGYPVRVYELMCKSEEVARRMNKRNSHRVSLEAQLAMFGRFETDLEATQIQPHLDADAAPTSGTATAPAPQMDVANANSSLVNILGATRSHLSAFVRPSIIVPT